MKKRVVWMVVGVLLAVSYRVFALAPEVGEAAETKVLPHHQPSTKGVAKSSVRVMTLNLAHGAKNRFGIAPIIRGAETIKERLGQNAKVFLREGADIVALQEADAPSWWSGRFHHVAFLAEKGLYPFYALGIHVKSGEKAYGTGFLSKYALEDVVSHRFRQSGMFKKGFVIGSFRWPDQPSKKVDVVSLHLHPSNKKIQRLQVRQVAHTAKQRGRSLIVMGDFNTTWQEDRSALHELVHDLRLKVYQPDDRNLSTHRAVGERRLDWIFVSQDLAFTSYRVIREGVVSDHDAVLAELVLAKRLPSSVPSSAPSLRPASVPARKPPTMPTKAAAPSSVPALR